MRHFAHFASFLINFIWHHLQAAACISASISHKQPRALLAGSITQSHHNHRHRFTFPTASHAASSPFPFVAEQVFTRGRTK
jgi:hypothetical protein